jgi:hypothetical protein
VFVAPWLAPRASLRSMRAYYVDMADPNDPAVYYVRATNTTKNEHVAYKCVGMASAHAKAAELRMTGYRDVVMSVSDSSSGSAQEARAPILLG